MRVRLFVSFIACLVFIPLLLTLCAIGISDKPLPFATSTPTATPSPTPTPQPRPHVSINLNALNAKAKRHQEYGTPPYKLDLPSWTDKFPLLKEVWIGRAPHIDHYRPLNPDGSFSTHAHPALGVICINPADKLAHWSFNGPTPVFFHEYAHILDGPHPLKFGVATDTHDAEFYRVLQLVLSDYKIGRTDRMVKPPPK